MLNLKEFQLEVHAWSLYNFGDQPAEYPLMGLVEETGELAHAILKTRQGIRGEQDIEDAIGDIMVYLMDFTARVGFKVYQVDLGMMSSTSVVHIGMCVGRLCDSYIHVIDHKPTRFQFENLVHCLSRLCDQLGLDFDEAVNKTWEQVKQRDWKKFPKNGRTE